MMDMTKSSLNGNIVKMRQNEFMTYVKESTEIIGSSILHAYSESETKCHIFTFMNDKGGIRKKGSKDSFFILIFKTVT